MENRQNYNQQLMQFRYLKDQRDMLSNQLEMLNASYNSLRTSKTTLENLKDVKKGDEILVPVGGNLNIKANIQDPDEVLFYVSDDTVIEKSIDGSIENLDTLLEQHEEQMNRLQESIQQVDARLQAMSAQLQRGYQNVQQ